MDRFEDRFEVPREDINAISSMAMHSERTVPECNRMSYRVQGSSSCIKSRSRLTEAEREERKIRRIIANRESARQTIRRRQALYDQLTKDAAALAIENENFKTEKKQVLNKFNDLKSTNERLKDMLDKATKAEAINNQRGDQDLLHINPSSSSTMFCGHPSMVPFFWPPFVHASDAFPSPVVPSVVSQDDPDQVMNKSNEMGSPVYMLPFPWFFPFQMQFIAQSSEPSNQYLQCGDIQNQSHMNVLCSEGLSSQAEGHVKKSLASNTTIMDSEFPLPTMGARQDCGLGVAADGTSRQTAETISSFNATSCAAVASVSPQPNQTAQEPQDDDVVEMAAVSPSRWGLATKSEDPITFPCKKSAGAVAAAEARKRRKELTKLKTLYYRNHRMR